MSTILFLKKSNAQKKLYFYKTQKMNYGVLFSNKFLEKIIMDNLVLEKKLKLRKFLLMYLEYIYNTVFLKLQTQIIMVLHIIWMKKFILGVKINIIDLDIRHQILIFQNLLKWEKNYFILLIFKIHVFFLYFFKI